MGGSETGGKGSAPEEGCGGVEGVGWAAAGTQNGPWALGGKYILG